MIPFFKMIRSQEHDGLTARKTSNPRANKSEQTLNSAIAPIDPVLRPGYVDPQDFGQQFFPQYFACGTGDVKGRPQVLQFRLNGPFF
jgi:hypothetical protein